MKFELFTRDEMSSKLLIIYIVASSKQNKYC